MEQLVSLEQQNTSFIRIVLFLKLYYNFIYVLDVLGLSYTALVQFHLKHGQLEVGSLSLNQDGRIFEHQRTRHCDFMLCFFAFTISVSLPPQESCRGRCCLSLRTLFTWRSPVATCRGKLSQEKTLLQVRKLTPNSVLESQSVLESLCAVVRKR